MPSPSSKEPVHSKLGPSKAGRWLKCKASVGFIESNKHRLPPDKPSVHALEGKKAHDYADKLLKGKKVVFDDKDMQEHIEVYVRHVKTRKEQLGEGTKLFVEQTIPLYYDKKQVGTADVVLVNPKTIHLIDLKYGEGVSVEAKRNVQLAIYLKSALVHLKIKLTRDTKVVLEIYQPRAQDGRIVRKWETTMGEVDELCDTISDTAMDILADPNNQPFHCEPEGVCRWCPAKSICPTYAATLLGDVPEAWVATAATVAVKVPEAGFPSADTLSDDQLARIIGVAGDLKDWLTEIEEHAMARMEAGDPVPHTKLVAGRNSRSWTDERKAFRVMKRFIPKAECMVTTVLSPAQVEKRLKNKKGLKKPITTRGSNMIAALIETTPGKPQLVHESDPRPAIDAKSILGEAETSLL